MSRLGLELLQIVFSSYEGHLNEIDDRNISVHFHLFFSLSSVFTCLGVTKMASGNPRLFTQNLNTILGCLLVEVSSSRRVASGLREKFETFFVFSLSLFPSNHQLIQDLIAQIDEHEKMLYVTS